MVRAADPLAGPLQEGQVYGVSERKQNSKTRILCRYFTFLVFAMNMALDADMALNLQHSLTLTFLVKSCVLSYKGSVSGTLLNTPGKTGLGLRRVQFNSIVLRKTTTNYCHYLRQWKPIKFTL